MSGVRVGAAGRAQGEKAVGFGSDIYLSSRLSVPKEKR
jgi:hypothetical protein